MKKEKYQPFAYLAILVECGILVKARIGYFARLKHAILSGAFIAAQRRLHNWTSDMNDQNKFQESKLSIDGQKSVLVRLARVIGHLQSIKRMTEEERDIEALLIQVSAVKSAMNGVRRVLMEELLKRRQERFDGEINFDEVLTLVERYMK